MSLGHWRVCNFEESAMASNSVRVTCPSCQARLVAPPEATEAATCPRCLAIVPLTPSAPAPSDPAGAIQTEPVAQPLPVPTAESSRSHAAAATCPSCARAVEPVWLFCPFCEEPLRPGRRRFSNVERDVQRDG